MFILYLPSPSDSLPYLIPRGPISAFRANHPKLTKPHAVTPRVVHTLQASTRRILPLGLNITTPHQSSSSLLWVMRRSSSCNRRARHSSATHWAATTKLPGDVDRGMVPHPHPDCSRGRQVSSDPRNDLHPARYPRLPAVARKRWAQEATKAPRPPANCDWLTQTIKA